MSPITAWTSSRLIVNREAAAVSIAQGAIAAPSKRARPGVHEHGGMCPRSRAPHHRQPALFDDCFQCDNQLDDDRPMGHCVVSVRRDRLSGHYERLSSLEKGLLLNLSASDLPLGRASPCGALATRPSRAPAAEGPPPGR